MDISKRLNILIILLASAICSLAVWESMHYPKEQQNRDFLGKARAISSAAVILSEDEEEEVLPLEKVDTSSTVYVGAFVPPPQDTTNIPSVFKKQASLQLPQAPEGFFTAVTNNYLLFREELAITPKLTKAIDTIHDNFILDIIPFSLSVKFDRIFLMLFRTKENFTKYTLRPAWSGAATDVGSHSIFIMESNDFKPNFVHELTHIYFDGFFAPQKPPLWLSEGFAVYMQSAAQGQDRNYWLRKNAKILSRSEYIDFEEFTTVTSLKDYKKEEVELWYAQAYSIVNYLLTKKDKDNFYQFAKNIKDGMPIGRALYRAYGMPFNTTRALEYAWQASLQSDVRKGFYDD